MEKRKPSNPEPAKELEWLAYYFVEHGKDEIAGEIFDEVKRMRTKLKQMRLASGNQDKRSMGSTEEKY